LSDAAPRTFPTKAPCTLEDVDDIFGTFDVSGRYFKAQEQAKAINLELKNVTTQITAANDQVKDREDALFLQLKAAGTIPDKSNAETRKALVTEAAFKDEATIAVKKMIADATFKKNTLAAELEGLQGDIRLYRDLVNLAIARLNFSTMAHQNLQNAALYLNLPFEPEPAH
jgi:hypothetical protein